MAHGSSRRIIIEIICVKFSQVRSFQSREVKLMKKVTTGVLLASIALFSLNASAGWTSAGTITRAYVHSTWGAPSVFVRTTAQQVQPSPGCAGTDYLLSSSDNIGFSEIMATLLAAQISGKQVQIYVHDSACLNDYPKVQHVILHTPAS